MKAYISKWYEKGWRITTENFGGAHEIEISDREFARLTKMQNKSDSLQKVLRAYIK